MVTRTMRGIYGGVRAETLLEHPSPSGIMHHNHISSSSPLASRVT